MADVTDELILEHLKRIQDRLSSVESVIRDLKDGQNQILRQLAGVRRDYADSLETSARLSSRIDRHDDRLERIERRLELSDA
ncbi:hypothetical protein FACS1894205_7110 [Alphaproteobacteria bacterium]|nr:hypothetical protein FACS1894205_7110 [Alphaproteobacteria bacterium]